MFTRSIARMAAVAALGGVFGLVTAANAGTVSATYLRVDVNDGVHSGFFEVATDDASHPSSDTWFWSTAFGGGNIPIGDDGSGSPIAVLNSANLSIVGDPQIALSFALTAGSSDTSVTITSATLSFGTLGSPDGVASAALTLTESNGDTAALTGLGGSGNSWLGTYDGGSVFAEFVPGLQVLTPNNSVSDSGNTGGFIPVGSPVSSMVSQYNFELSAFDQASGTSNFVIVPEPAGLVGALVGVLALTLRRR